MPASSVPPSGRTTSAAPARPALVVLGSVNLDLVVRNRQLPRPGETVTGGQFFQAAGGKGANQAVAAARCATSPVSFIAAVGDDPHGREALASLQATGLDCTYLQTIKGESTGIALILVDHSGENLISVASGANACLTEQHVAQAETAFENASLLLCQLETPLSTVAAALARAHGQGVRTMLNPAPVPAGGLPAELYQHIDLLLPNRGELAALTGLPCETPGELRTAAETLRQRGCSAVLVTCGSAGAWLLEADHWQHIPPFAVQAVDTTAAGDAFCGALAVQLAAGTSLEHALRFASAAAALSVQQAGAQPSLPTREQVEHFLRETI